MDIEIKNEDAVITTCEQILAFNREASTQIFTTISPMTATDL